MDPSKQHPPFRSVRTLAEGIGEAPRLRVLAGFDAFIDSICHVVKSRDAPGPGGYTPIDSLEILAARIHDAAGLSASFELVTRTTKPGGNALLSASALASMGTQVDFVGAIADPNQPEIVHPMLETIAELFDSATPIAPPGMTDALEFSDGKLMLGRPQSLDLLTPKAILGDDSRGPYTQMLDHADALIFGNWAMHHELENIWRQLAASVFPKAARLPRACFVDLADITRRNNESILGGICALQAVNSLVPVTHSLNAREATHLAHVLGVSIQSPLHPGSTAAELTDAADSLRVRLGFERVIIHTHSGASSATAVEVSHVRTAHNPSPRLSTGAGDHFNAGCLLALLHGEDESATLATGCALASYYIANGRAPVPDELAAHAIDLDSRLRD